MPRKLLMQKPIPEEHYRIQQRNIAQCESRYARRDRFGDALDHGLQQLRDMAANDPDNSYDMNFLEQVYRYALLGCTNLEIARIYEIEVGSFDNWLHILPGLRFALHLGRDHADAEVARALYQRATGYSHPAYKIFYDKEAGKTVQVEYTQHYPPDTAAASRWLINRRRHKEAPWNDTHVQVDVTQADPDLPAPLFVINPVTVVRQENGYVKQIEGTAEDPDK